MKPLGKTQSSPPTGSDLSAFAFERGDCRLYQDVLAGYDASSLPQRGEGSQHTTEHPGRRQGKKVNKDTHAALLQTQEPVLQHLGSHTRHRAQEPNPSSHPIPSHPTPPAVAPSGHWERRCWLGTAGSVCSSGRCLLVKKPPKGAFLVHFNFLLSFEIMKAGAGGLVHSPFKHLSAQLIPAPF